MMLLSDFVIALLKEWQIDDLPVNVLIGVNIMILRISFLMRKLMNTSSRLKVGLITKAVER